MLKLDRYIRNTVFLAMLLVLLVLGSLDFIFTVFDEIGETNERYQALDALKYVCFIIPRHIYELLPMSALIGALVGLGIMASSNELVVMQAAGVSVSRIVWSVMKPTGVVMVLGLVLGEFIAPTLEIKAEVDKAITNGEQTVLSRSGFWQKNGNEYMHFNAIDPSGILHGVSIYQYEDQRLVSNTFATEASFQPSQESADTPRWLLKEGKKTLFQYSENGDTNSLVSSFESTLWQVDLTPELLQVLIVDSDKMAISDLYSYAQRFERQGQDASVYLMSFWKKLLQPLTTGVLVLVAISFIFGPLREATMGSRVSTAICFALGFFLFQRLLSNVGLLFQISPFLAVMIPIAVTGLLGYRLLSKST